MRDNNKEMRMMMSGIWGRESGGWGGSDEEDDDEEWEEWEEVDMIL